jgi:hypothetical protein
MVHMECFGYIRSCVGYVERCGCNIPDRSLQYTDVYKREAVMWLEARLEKAANVSL